MKIKVERMRSGEVKKNLENLIVESVGFSASDVFFKTSKNV